MSQSVEVPGVGTLQFPDGMSQPDMAAAIQKNFPQIHEKPPAETQETPATWGGAARGVADAALTIGSGIAQQAAAVPRDFYRFERKFAQDVVGGPFSKTPEEKSAQTKQDAVPGLTEKVQQLLSHKPKTTEGKYLLDALQTIFSPVAEAGEVIHKAIAKRGGEETANMLGDITSLVGGGGALAGPSKIAGKITKSVSTEAKVKDLVSNLSGGAPLGRGQVGKDIKTALGKTEQEARAAGDKAYKERDALIPEETPVPLTESAQVANQYTTRTVLDPKIKAFSDKLRSGQMNFDDLTALRSELGDNMGSDRNVNRQLREMREAVNKDIEKAAEGLSPQAKDAWLKATSEWKKYRTSQDEITNVLGRNWKADTTTDLYKQVLKAARTDPEKITKVMDSIKDPATRKQFAASMIQRMADKEGQFNGDRLVSSWGNMDPDARAAVFKSVGGDYEKNMTHLVEKLERIKEGHTGLIKEVSGVGVAAVLAHLIPGGSKVVGGITLIREAYKFSPATVEKLLSSPRAVKELAAMPFRAGRKYTGAALLDAGSYKSGQMTLQNDQ